MSFLTSTPDVPLSGAELRIEKNKLGAFAVAITKARRTIDKAENGSPEYDTFRNMRDIAKLYAENPKFIKDYIRFRSEYDEFKKWKTSKQKERSDQISQALDDALNRLDGIGAQNRNTFGQNVESGQDVGSGQDTQNVQSTKFGSTESKDSDNVPKINTRRNRPDPPSAPPPPPPVQSTQSTQPNPPTHRQPDRYKQNFQNNVFGNSDNVTHTVAQSGGSFRSAYPGTEVQSGVPGEVHGGMRGGMYRGNLPNHMRDDYYGPGSFHTTFSTGRNASTGNTPNASNASDTPTAPANKDKKKKNEWPMDVDDMDKDKFELMIEAGHEGIIMNSAIARATNCERSHVMNKIEESDADDADDADDVDDADDADDADDVDDSEQELADMVAVIDQVHAEAAMNDAQSADPGDSTGLTTSVTSVESAGSAASVESSESLISQDGAPIIRI